MRKKTFDIRSSYEMPRDVKLMVIPEATRQLVVREPVDGKLFSENWNCECWDFQRGERDSDANVYEEESVSYWEQRKSFEAGDKSGCEIYTDMDAVYVDTNYSFKSWVSDVGLG